MLKFLETGQPWWIGFILSAIAAVPVGVLAGMVGARMIQFADAKKIAADAVLGLAVFFAMKPEQRTSDMLLSFQTQMRSVITQFAHLGHRDAANLASAAREELVRYCVANRERPPLRVDEQQHFSEYLSARVAPILHARPTPEAFFKWDIF